MFDIKSLTYYACARQTGSLTLAAQELGVSVSAISTGIKRLEDLLCIPLLLRTKKGITPATGTASILQFCLLLLSGLHRIERAFAEGNAPIDFAQLEEKTEQMMALDDSLLPFLRECAGLRLSPKLLFRFIAVYEQGSINRAASNLGVAQPQISRQIRKIEALLGTPMFARKSTGQNKGLIALRSGEILYAGAVQLNGICEHILKRSDLLFRQEVKTTKIGCIPPFSTKSDLCNLISDICTNWPQLDPKGHIRIITTTTNNLVTQLKNNDLHAVIIDSPRMAEGYAERVLAQHPLKLAGNDLHHLEAGRQVSLDEVADLINNRAFVLPSRNTGLRNLIDQWLEQHGLKARSLIEVDSMTIAAALTRNGSFISLLPAFSFLDDDHTIQTYPIPDAPVLVQRLVWKSEASQSRPIVNLHKIMNNRPLPQIITY
ncbi:MAG: LysR family transcriptional regulator [Cohaesibacter sp.]|jgi:DNA-binding transcriptional LysR family regulator|nr:LysR family transcriptional regulator [Cohaesibacter sp.]